MVQTDVKGEMGATLERMGGEEGIVPERSEWFRSRRIIGTAHGQDVNRRGRLHKGALTTSICRHTYHVSIDYQPDTEGRCVRAAVYLLAHGSETRGS